MTDLPYYIVDVFTETKYAGNQLAVVRNASSISDKRMQKIAREMNFSETSFILSGKKKDGGFDVRIFTPKSEVPFAGHPTLGTAYIIQQEIIRRPEKTVTLNLKVGQIHVTPIYKKGSPDILWMKQKSPVFGETFSAETMAEVLSLRKEAIDQSFPIQDVSTGLPSIIVPLKNLESIKNCRINREKYFEFIQDKNAKLILVFCAETYYKSNKLNVRVFAEYDGVPEDPATGSANGCLAAYLAKHKFFGKDRIENIRVEQGYEIGRPSLLLLRAKQRGEEIDVFVGGKVQMVARGALV